MNLKCYNVTNACFISGSSPFITLNPRCSALAQLLKQILYAHP